MKVPVGTNIYLKFGRSIQIPVNPEEIEITHPSNNVTHDVLGVGEIVVPKMPGLSEITWESFLPGDDSDPYVSDYIDPETFVRRILRSKENKDTGRVVITRSGLFDTNMRCIVSDFTIRDKGGEPGDIYYSITLQEYRDYSPETVTIRQEVPADQSEPDKPLDEIVTEATLTEQRPVETPTMRVGASVTANGRYCNDEYGSAPYGTASGLKTTVTRMNPGTPYPIHIGYYGWMQESDLQITG